LGGIILGFKQKEIVCVPNTNVWVLHRIWGPVMKLKPCDCHDQVTADKLNEQGIQHNDQGIFIKPGVVILEMGHTSIKINMKRFEMFARWYLEEQELDSK